MSSIDYKLPGFQPLTYMGQKELCEMLDLKLINSINCCRNEIPRCSNLSEYFPCKMLPIPGDGNCLFSSISYCLTGNMDNFHKIRAIIVENMIGNLKEACNKFIANKFPMSAINFRNVNDYIVKSKMRNNSTWGSDVELFALALLLRTDIWIYSTEFGNKWMLFSGRGASLIDALTLPVVNTAGSIYLNHNGLHYEPVLGLGKK